MPAIVRWPPVTALTVFSPAKLNLMLAITGRRADGFHDLVSVVAPVAWGDTLTASVDESGRDAASPDYVLTCNDPAVPRDGSNLIIKAAQTFQAATGWRRSVHFALEKRIPIGAGLGGGSSNAVAALRTLNRLAGEPLAAGALAAVAATLGSDCALFLQDAPVIMRGRGDAVVPVPPAVTQRLHGRSVLIFKPAFGIATAWAYGRMAAGAPQSYISPTAAEARVRRWLEAAGSTPIDLDATSAATEELLFNNMEAPAFLKFPALPALLDGLAKNFGLRPHLSGSGSACFAFLPATAHVPAISDCIRRAWGESATIVRTQLA